MYSVVLNSELDIKINGYGEGIGGKVSIVEGYSTIMLWRMFLFSFFFFHCYDKDQMIIMIIAVRRVG